MNDLLLTNSVLNIVLSAPFLGNRIRLKKELNEG